MQANFVFSETSPSAGGTAASSQPVQGGDGRAGIAWPLDDFESMDVVAELVGATSDTLDVYLQTSPDEGNTWVDAIHWPQLSAGHAAVVYRNTLSLASTPTAPTVVGEGLSPALAANTVVPGAFGDRARLVMVAGASTSAGAKVVVRLALQRPRTNQT